MRSKLQSSNFEMYLSELGDGDFGGGTVNKKKRGTQRGGKLTLIVGLALEYSMPTIHLSVSL